jgi:acetoin utilization deacetylase AcuC-like enzyme
MFQRMAFPSLRRECSVREQFRVKWKQVIDEMERFRPEFVIFSASFDAHDEDPLASCDLLEDDFKWATEVVLDACHRLSPNVQMPIMSILEGGYDIPALTASAVAHVQALIAGSPPRRKEQR